MIFLNKGIVQRLTDFILVDHTWKPPEKDIFSTKRFIAIVECRGNLIRNVKNLNQWNLLPWEVAEKSFFSDFYGRNKKRSNLIMFFSFPAYHLHIHSRPPIGLIPATWRTCGETTTLWINATTTEPVIWKVTTRGRRRSCTQKQA